MCSLAAMVQWGASVKHYYRHLLRNNIPVQKALHLRNQVQIPNNAKEYSSIEKCHFPRVDAGLISKIQWDKLTMQLSPPLWRVGQQIPELKKGQPFRLGNLREFDSARVNNHGAMSCHGLGFFVGNGSGTVHVQECPISHRTSGPAPSTPLYTPLLPWFLSDPTSIRWAKIYVLSLKHWGEGTLQLLWVRFYIFRSRSILLYI